MTEDYEAELADQVPSFDLRLEDQSDEFQSSGEVMDFQAYQKQEGVFTSSDDSPTQPGERPVLIKHWKMLENALAAEEKRIHATLTRELHDPTPRPRIIWEVYAGASRMSEVAESLGCFVETFGYETDYDFDLPSHRSYFLEYQAHVMPDEVLYAPRCGLWSRMQAINATTEAKKDLLQQQRQIHHDHHLRFVKKSYLAQVHGGRQAHLEQPHGALSWETTSLKSLPGLYVTFDQCCYGAMCLDSDGQWKLVRKTTGLKTTKRAMAQAMCLRCDGSHEHCKLEGQFPGLGRSRTSYMEDYQPAMAAVLAAAMAGSS